MSCNRIYWAICFAGALCAHSMFARADVLTDYCNTSAARYPYLDEELLAQSITQIQEILAGYGGADWIALEPLRVTLLKASVDELFDALANPARLTDVMTEGHLANFELMVATNTLCPIYTPIQVELIREQHDRIAEGIVVAATLNLEAFRMSQVPHRLKGFLLRNIEMASLGSLDPRFKKPLSEGEVQEVLSQVRALVAESDLSIAYALNLSDEAWGQKSEEEKALTIQEDSSSIAMRIANSLGSALKAYEEVSRRAMEAGNTSSAACNPVSEERRRVLEAKVNVGMEAQFNAAYEMQQQAALGSLAE